MRNLEFKARVPDARAMLAAARALGADLWGDLRQTDTYFRVARGRLKLRETAGFQAELIYYERDEAAALRPSDYTTVALRDGDAMRAILAAALGVQGVVRKRRTLLLLDTIRIHLDNVEELGHYIEIEVPVKEDEAAAEARFEALVAGLGLSWQSCIRGSYIDLLSAVASSPEKQA